MTLSITIMLGVGVLAVGYLFAEFIRGRVPKWWNYAPRRLYREALTAGVVIGLLGIFLAATLGQLVEIPEGDIPVSIAEYATALSLVWGMAIISWPSGVACVVAVKARGGFARNWRDIASVTLWVTGVFAVAALLMNA
ncbi:MAG: hypothetical protein PF961_07760 [Planctomycetota bacterium]|nr:hypothetical protein [Planctomycetota bacterium]